MSEQKQTRKQAIKSKCLDCSGGIQSEVRRCPVTTCPLWPYRKGAEQRSAGTDESAQEEQAEA